jgi:putative transposase
VKKKRFSVEQIVAVLKQAELGVPVAEVIRKVGISEQTFYRWKKQYVGHKEPEVAVATMGVGLDYGGFGI